MTNPSSRPPAGVPTSGGNTKYAIVAAALLLAIGGIVFWRRASDQSNAPAPPPAIPSVAQSTPPPNPKEDDIPPPPPLEEKPEAGAGPRIIYVQAAPCDAKCAGTATSELAQALQVRGMQARRCYNEALSRDPSLHGHLVFSVRIGQAGNVCSVNVTTNDMGTPKVANCAAHILGGGAYPAPRGGCIDSTVPISFVAQGQ
jgi:hypothetical protein